MRGSRPSSIAADWPADRAAELFAAAVADLAQRGLADLGTLAVACETHRTRRDRPIPVLPDLNVDDDHVVIPHDLERYDAK